MKPFPTDKIHHVVCHECKSLHETIIKNILQLLDDPTTHKSHFFHGRYENIYIDPEKIPSMSMSPSYLGQNCRGLIFNVLQPDSFKSVEFGIHLIATVQSLETDQIEYNLSWLTKLLGDDQIAQKMANGVSAREIIDEWQSDLLSFLDVRKKYMLYD